MRNCATPQHLLVVMPDQAEVLAYIAYEARRWFRYVDSHPTRLDEWKRGRTVALTIEYPPAEAAERYAVQEVEMALFSEEYAALKFLHRQLPYLRKVADKSIRVFYACCLAQAHERALAVA